MASLPNIPSVVVSIEDMGYVEPILSGGRQVFIMGHTKYGSEELTRFASYEDFEFKNGKMNITRYGFGQKYAKKALQYTQDVLWKRLLPEDAKYSHRVIKEVVTPEGNVLQLSDIPFDRTEPTSGVADPDAILSDQSMKIAFIAKARGVGYNDLTLRFTPNAEYPKFWADNNGVELFPNTFLDVAIYEKTNSGTRAIGTPFTVSLLPYDPETNGAILDPYSGENIFIKDYFTIRNDFIDCIIEGFEDDLTDVVTRTAIFNLLIAGDKNTDGSYSLLIPLKNGHDGSLVDTRGRIVKSISESLQANFINTDETIREKLYPKFKPAYIVDYTCSPTVINAITNLVDYLESCLNISSFPIAYTYQTDIDNRANNFGISSWNSMYYTGQFNKAHTDEESGRVIYMPSSYYALENHLIQDAVNSITEPVANIDKGAIRDKTNLSYAPKSAQIEQLRQKQLNSIIIEPDGTYFIDQLTATKKAGVLSRGHVTKLVQQINRDLPTILKDLLQRKATNWVQSEAYRRVDLYMARWLESPNNVKDSAIKWYNIKIIYDETRLTLNILVNFKVIRSIEKIAVQLMVQ